MNNSSPLQPREKIQHRSVSALSAHELIQAIIGSGSRKYPVKKLSRTVLKLITKGTVHYADLIQIPGLGTAKAACLAAVFELSRRHAVQTEDTTYLIKEMLATRSQRHTSLALLSHDGAKKIIRREIIAISLPIDTSSLQMLCRWLVLDNAPYATIGVRQNNYAQAAELCRTLYRAFRSVGVQLLDFRADAINEKGLYAKNTR